MANTFQSTGSVWSPTDYVDGKVQLCTISIHGLRVEPDHIKMGICLSYLYFNPRAPCGARPLTFATATVIKHFNPRAPCGARR